MKIMQVIPYFCFGGAETMCENLTYALRKLGHEVVVVSLYNEHTPIARRMEADGVRILYLDKKLGLDTSMVGKLRRLMKEECPDVVHTHLDVIKYAVLAARLAGVRRCVHTVHNVADKEAEGTAQKLINKAYFHLGWSVPVALSSLVQETIAEFYHLDLENILVIFNGVDLSRCQVKEHYRPGDSLTFLHIGRFNQQKNHGRLLRVFQKLQSSHPGCRLQLIGDGELRLETEDLARALGIQTKVEFLGLQSDVHPYLQEADVFVLPSDYEGMPMTLIEAMGTGLPIAATAVGGVPDMLKNGQSALLTSCNEEEILATWETLVTDEALRESLGRQALDESGRFSADHMAQAYCRIYQN